MEKRKNSKRNILIALAAICLVSVFMMSSCMGAFMGSVGAVEQETAPADSFAVINIQGTIQAGPDNPMDSVGYNHAVLTEYVDQLIEDETNHGILLKVNSGGGTVYHSDEMYLKLLEYKEKTGRPIRAYFEQTAASGAYYISCAADNIMANKNCWTGSIGVIISYINMAGLYEKIGLEEIVIASGDNKGMGSSAGTLTDDQRAIYQSLVDESYEEFVSIVAKGRNMPVEDVKILADGRIYTATQALENGLIDSIGLWEEAVAQMEELTGCQPYEKQFYSQYSWLDYLLYSVADITPKSDIQALGEMTSSQLSGVPLYLYK